MKLNIFTRKELENRHVQKNLVDNNCGKLMLCGKLDVGFLSRSSTYAIEAVFFEINYKTDVIYVTGLCY